MQCPYCRKQIADHVHFCPYCGRSLGNKPLSKTGRESYSRRRRKKRSYRGALIFLLVILILLAGGGGFLFLTGRAAVWQNARSFAKALNAGDLEKLDSLADAACSAYRGRSGEDLPAGSDNEGGTGTEKASGSGKTAAQSTGSEESAAVKIPKEYRSALEQVYEVRAIDGESGESAESAASGEADVSGQSAASGENGESGDPGGSGGNDSLLDMVLLQDKVHIASMTMDQLVLTVEGPDLSGIYEDEALSEALKGTDAEEAFAEYVKSAPRRKTKAAVPYLPGRGDAAIDYSVGELTDALYGGLCSQTEEIYGQIMGKLMESESGS